MSDYKKKFIAYATEIPIVINNWLNDPINPVISRGEIEVKYGGIIADETPQKNPNTNLVRYITWRSKETDCASIAKPINASTTIMLFFSPKMLTILVESKDPFLERNYQ